MDKVSKLFFFTAETLGDSRTRSRYFFYAESDDYYLILKWMAEEEVTESIWQWFWMVSLRSITFYQEEIWKSDNFQFNRIENREAIPRSRSLRPLQKFQTGSWKESIAEQWNSIVPRHLHDQSLQKPSAWRVMFLYFTIGAKEAQALGVGRKRP